MKKLTIILCQLLCGAILSYAQNTFPASENAGIGTTNPQSFLHIGDGSGVGIGHRSWMQKGTFLDSIPKQFRF